MKHNILVTFDIDGTILTSPGGGIIHKKSIINTIFNIYKIEINDVEKFIGYTFSGTSDRAITKSVIQKITNKENISEEELNFFMIEQCKQYELLYDGKGDIIPGVENLIQNLLKLENVKIALCTGNYETIGWLKLKSVNVDHYFKDHIGGFGEKEFRKDFLKDAILKSQLKHNIIFDKIIHIGDALQDVEAAIENNATPIAIRLGGKLNYPNNILIVDDYNCSLNEILNVVNN